MSIRIDGFDVCHDGPVQQATHRPQRIVSCPALRQGVRVGRCMLHMFDILIHTWVHCQLMAVQYLGRYPSGLRNGCIMLRTLVIYCFSCSVLLELSIGLAFNLIYKIYEMKYSWVRVSGSNSLSLCFCTFLETGKRFNSANVFRLCWSHITVAFFTTVTTHDRMCACMIAFWGGPMMSAAANSKQPQNEHGRVHRQ